MKRPKGCSDLRAMRAGCGLLLELSPSSRDVPKRGRDCAREGLSFGGVLPSAMLYVSGLRLRGLPRGSRKLWPLRGLGDLRGSTIGDRGVGAPTGTIGCVGLISPSSLAAMAGGVAGLQPGNRSSHL